MGELNKITSTVISVFSDRYNHDLFVKSINYAKYRHTEYATFICNKCNLEVVITNVINRRISIGCYICRPYCSYVETSYDKFINTKHTILSSYIISCEEQMIENIIG